jgi:hypothetical protein
MGIAPALHLRLAQMLVAGLVHLKYRLKGKKLVLE